MVIIYFSLSSNKKLKNKNSLLSFKLILKFKIEINLRNVFTNSFFEYTCCFFIIIYKIITYSFNNYINNINKHFFRI